MTHRDNCQPEVEKFLDKQKTDGWNVLEIGPGTDNQFRSLFERKYGMKYTAIDPLPLTNGPNCYQGRMEALPFPSNRYDLVFACHAFEHCERPIDALKEFLRVLKPGGYVFILTPKYCEHHVLLADADHINVVTDMQMIRKLHYVGFPRNNIEVYVSELAPKEQDHNLVSYARKP